MNYAGILPPLLESLLARERPHENVLLGYEISVGRPGVKAVIAVDAASNPHFLLTPPASAPSRFERFQLRSLRIANHDWSVAGEPVGSYLDAACRITGSSLVRPFLSFCEDVLRDLDQGCSAEDAVYRTCVRWHRFWTEEGTESPPETWIRGTLGELQFLHDLIVEHGPRAVGLWTGPDAADHDFQAGTAIAFEVKSSTHMPFTIDCNLRQLDTTIFPALYLVCFLLKPADDGASLVSVAEAIEQLVHHDELSLDLFFQRLARAGYKRHLEEEYRRHRYSLASPEYYAITTDFPRLTVQSFSNPPDGRIRDIRYQLQLTGLPSLGAADPGIIAARRRLCQEQP